MKNQTSTKPKLQGQIYSKKSPNKVQFSTISLHLKKVKFKIWSTFSPTHQNICQRSSTLASSTLHYVWFSQFWSHFHGTMHCLPQRLKSTLFEIFPNGGCPKGTWSVEKISNNVDFSLWGNRATTQNTFIDIFKWDQNHENHTLCLGLLTFTFGRLKLQLASAMYAS